jgi:hypothetical protein
MRLAINHDLPAHAAFCVPWNKSVAEVDALILHSQNENIEQLGEEDRPL